jgi:predicted DsbA family dithiol-disulfide isomerase
MLVRLDAWTDFTCPYCFLATLTLDRLHQENQVDLHWRAYQLRPTNSQAMPPDVRSMIEKEHARVTEIARAQYGLVLRPGPIGISTRAAHIANKFADSQHKGNQFHLAAMKAYWLEGRSLEGRSFEDKQILQDIAEQVGLDRADLLEALENPSFAAAVDTDIMQAKSREITGVPAVVFAGKYILAGAQPYAVFKRLLDQVREQAREAEYRHSQRRAQAGD